MTTAAVLIARIRSRERLMASIRQRNPETFETNPYFVSLQTAVSAYRSELTQIELAGAEISTLTKSR